VVPLGLQGGLLLLDLFEASDQRGEVIHDLHLMYIDGTRVNDEVPDRAKFRRRA
jgi:hypothetical protein